LSFSPFFNSSLLFMIHVLLISYFLLKSKIKKQPDLPETLPDLLLNAFITGVIVWKLTPLLSQPELLWTNPIALLYLQPSGVYIGIAALAGTIYLIIGLKGNRTAYLLLLDTLIVGITLSFLLKSLFFWEYGKETTLPWGISLSDPTIRYHPIHYYQFLVSLICSVWFGWKGKGVIGTGKVFALLSMFWGFGLFLISFFTQPTVIYFGLDLTQIASTLLIILGYVCYSFLRKGAP
jgi:hypothetical protein